MKAKSVLITGSSKGLGKSLALVFARQGYDVIIHGRNKEKLEGVKKEIIENSPNCSVEMVAGDLTSDETLDKLSKIAEEKNVEILINNAAVGSSETFKDYTSEEIEEILKINFLVPVKLSKKIYPIFLNKNSGMIVNINSMDGLKISREGGTAYGSSKFGLRGFSDALRFESKKYNIKIIGVYLSGMKTDMYRAGGGEDTNCMEPDEVAEVIFNVCKNYDSCMVDEIIIGRIKY